MVREKPATAVGVGDAEGGGENMISLEVGTGVVLEKSEALALDIQKKRSVRIEKTELRVSRIRRHLPE